MAQLPLDDYFINRAKGKRNGEVHAYHAIDPAKTALVVVDMQDYFVKPGMPSYTPDAQAIVPNINRLAVALRDAGGTVAWVQTEAPADAGDWPNRAEATSAESWAARQELLARDGAGFGIYETCAVAPEDAIVIKYRYSAFIPYPSDLSELLAARGIDTLLITGVATSTCCESTARDASMWDFRTIMVADGNADVSPLLHKNTLGKFLIAFGDVQMTNQLIEKIAAAQTAVPAQ